MFVTDLLARDAVRLARNFGGLGYSWQELVVSCAYLYHI